MSVGPEGAWVEAGLSALAEASPGTWSFIPIFNFFGSLMEFNLARVSALVPNFFAILDKVSPAATV